MDTPRNKKQTTDPAGDLGNENTPEFKSELFVEKPAPAAKPKARTRIKPTIEGINSPKVTQEVVVGEKSPLTEQEKELIFEPQNNKKAMPKLIPQNMADRAAKPEHKVGRWIITGVVLLVIIAGGYIAYIWNVERHVLPVPEYSNNQTPTQQTDNNYQATTSPDSKASTTPLTTTPSTTPSNSQPLKQLTILKTPTGYLNVRDLPSTSGKQITQVHPGETYYYVETKSGWYKIVLPEGVTGWIIGDYVSVEKNAR